MSPYWQQHWYGAAAFLFVLVVLAFAPVGSEGKLPASFANVQSGARGSAEEKTWAERKTDEIQNPADYFVDQDQYDYLGYTIERRLKKVLLEGDEEPWGIWVDVQFINLKHGKSLVQSFDAEVNFGRGNSADFGFFPFLANGHKQLFISQDIALGGCQWIVSLAPRFKILFDGQKLGVCRKPSHLSVVDLDDDGVFEIMLEVTDTEMMFVVTDPDELHEKMGMHLAALPKIVFKYDPSLERYLPANSLFKNYVYEALEQAPLPDATLQSRTEHRSTVLNYLLTYIYAGEENRAWKFFDKSYQLNDKEEIRNWVKEMLRNEPVYNLIYKHGKRK